MPPKPFLYDWSNPPSATYNGCVVDAFCQDFWLNVSAGAYALSQIPLRYQQEKGFLGVLRTHITGIRRKWLKSQRNPPSAAQSTAIAQRNAQTSRIGTVSNLTCTRSKFLLCDNPLAVSQPTRSGCTYTRPRACYSSDQCSQCHRYEWDQLRRRSACPRRTRKTVRHIR